MNDFRSGLDAYLCPFEVLWVDALDSVEYESSVVEFLQMAQNRPNLVGRKILCLVNNYDIIFQIRFCICRTKSDIVPVDNTAFSFSSNICRDNFSDDSLASPAIDPWRSASAFSIHCEIVF